MSKQRARRSITVSATAYNQAKAYCKQFPSNTIAGLCENLIEMACTIEEITHPPGTCNLFEMPSPEEMAADAPAPPPQRPHLRLVVS